MLVSDSSLLYLKPWCPPLSEDDDVQDQIQSISLMQPNRNSSIKSRPNSSSMFALMMRKL